MRPLRLVVDEGCVTDRGLTDAVLGEMSDDGLRQIVCDADAYQGDRVRAQFELQRRDVFPPEPIDMRFFSNHNRADSKLFELLMIFAAVAVLGALIYFIN